jgi:hypothetical protein
MANLFAISKKYQKKDNEEITLILLKWLNDCNSHKKLNFNPYKKKGKLEKCQGLQTHWP